MSGREKGPLTEPMYYVLMAFLDREMYGTEIGAFVERKTAGRVRLGPGTLYGAISSLLEKGWIVLYSADPGSRKKKEYVITNQGREVFSAELRRLRELVENGEKMEDGV